MKKLLVGAAGAAALLSLTACDTTSAIAPYTASMPNVLAFQSALKPKGLTVKVGDFSADPSVTKPGCRLVGTLDVTSGKPIEQYVRDAMQTELFTAQVYDAASPVVITGKVDQVKVNTMMTGSWTLGLQVQSNIDPVGYHVQVTHNFSSSYMAEAACANATNAFAPSVQELMAQVVANPGFIKLVSRN